MRNFTITPGRSSLAAILLVVAALANIARADIYQWEYSTPGNPDSVRLRSETLAPDGAGVDAVPGANLSSLNLTRAYLVEANLTGADLSQANLADAYLWKANLTDADLSHANLTGALFWNSTLTSANFTGAHVQGAEFRNAVGLTAAQLYTTASYQAGDLTGINLSGNNNLAGANFAGQNLTNADLGFATLTGANFAGAEVRGANLGRHYQVGGTGVTSAQLYSTASYQTGDLSGIALWYNNMTGWNFAGQNLTNASFGGATLTGANFTGAHVQGAHFGHDPSPFANSTGIAPAQLYSTASYQAGDLTGINLVGNILAGANLSGQNLTSASFYGATLTGANFSGAEIRGANFELMTFGGPPGTGITPAQLHSTASYQAGDLTGINLRRNNLAGANLAGQNLTNADFGYAALTGANFAGAEIRGANFNRTHAPGGLVGTGLTLAQLYSTASYQAGDLTGISLWENNLTGANLAGQNLTNARFNYATLTGANLSGAEVRGANFERYPNGGTGITAAQLHSTASYQAGDLSGINLRENNLAGANLAGQNLTQADLSYATLTGANLTGADVRGGSFWDESAVTTNLIHSYGAILGLDLTGGAELVVRDYNPWFDGSEESIPIRVEEHATMAAGGTLRLLLEADDWGSTISFAPGIPVALGGTLELLFAPGVDVAGQVGRTFELFDWTGVAPSGTFAVSTPYAWDLSSLYATGQATLTAVAPLPGDFNGDGLVDAADYTVWRDGLGANYTWDDYQTWKANFGATLGTGSIASRAVVPEPSYHWLMAPAAASLLILFQRRRWRLESVMP